MPLPLLETALNVPADVVRLTLTPLDARLFPAESRSCTVIAVDPDPAAIDASAAVTTVANGSNTPIDVGVVAAEVTGVSPVLVKVRV